MAAGKKKPRALRVWVSKYIATPAGKDKVEGVIRTRRQPFHWYARATLTLDPRPARRKEKRS